jgi:hypothetical protein
VRLETRPNSSRYVDSFLSGFPSCLETERDANISFLTQVLDDVTGGFIRAKKMPKRELYRSTTDVVKSGQVVDGVMGTMYKADWPSRK